MAISDTRKRFNESFRQARARGDDVFEFEGKKYTTKLTGDKKATPKETAEDLGPTGKTGRGRIADTMTHDDYRYLSAKVAADEYAKKRNEEESGFKKGGKVMNESMMMKKEGRGMAKANMQKVASKAVKGHEKRMHGMRSGGTASKRADGIAIRGKTKGRMV